MNHHHPLFSILKNSAVRMKSSNRSPSKKKLIKNRGSFYQKKTNIIDSNAKLGHPFPNQYSFPETNTMIMNPYSDTDISQTLESFSGHEIVPPQSIILENQSPLNLTDNYGDYIDKQLSRTIENLEPRWKTTRSRKKTVTKSNQYLSVEDSIRLVNAREYTLVSIDNEFYERNNKHVIEVGVSIYKPHFQKFSLFPHITNIHFIIKETLPLRNGVFVPDSKMSNITGESYIISKDDIPKAMDSIFEKLGPKTLIVGHSVKGDLDSFSNLNWSPPVLNIIDTTSLWFSLFGSSNIKSRLSYILDKLGVPNAYLHNGVNDAYYTLIACLMLCSTDLRNNLKLKVEVQKAISSSSSSSTEENSDDSELESHSESELEPQMESMSLNKEEEFLPIHPSQSNNLVSASDIIKDIDQGKRKSIFQKKAKKVKPIVRIRCGVSDEAIDRKYISEKKVINPRSNYFFKPVKFSQVDLDRKMSELSL